MQADLTLDYLTIYLTLFNFSANHPSSTSHFLTERLTRVAVATVGGAEGGDELCQLQDHHNHPLATQPERRTRLQRLRPLLQTPQRK